MPYMRGGYSVWAERNVAGPAIATIFLILKQAGYDHYLVSSNDDDTFVIYYTNGESTDYGNYKGVVRDGQWVFYDESLKKLVIMDDEDFRNTFWWEE